MARRKIGMNNGGISGNILVKIFENTIETQTQVMNELGTTCKAVVDNTKATRELVEALKAVPLRLCNIEKSLRILRWSLIPIVLILATTLMSLALKH
jgi:hypothetical protein